MADDVFFFLGDSERKKFSRGLFALYIEKKKFFGVLCTVRIRHGTRATLSEMRLEIFEIVFVVDLD